jgi:hypothetical protein
MDLAQSFLDQGSEVRFRFGLASVYPGLVLNLDHRDDSLDGAAAHGAFVDLQLLGELGEEIRGHCSQTVAGTADRRNRILLWRSIGGQ